MPSKLWAVELTNKAKKQLKKIEKHREIFDIYQLFESYELRSTIITSQLPVNKWHDVIGESTIADAILDRLVHNSYRIELAGESMRKNKAKGEKEKVD